MKRTIEGFARRRARNNAWHRRKYATDPVWREKRKAKAKAAHLRIDPTDKFIAHLRQRYHLTLAAFIALWERQGFRCALCGRRLSFGAMGYAVDHDHVTDRVRGILCGFCNRSLGMFERWDLQTVLDYLRG